MQDDQTLIDMCFKDGVLCKIVKHSNGTKEYVPVEQEDSFEGVETKPLPWHRTDTNILEKKSFTRDEHVDRSCRAEAILVKLFSESMKNGDKCVSTNGNEAFKSVIVDLCKAIGGDWVDKIKDVK